MKIVRKNGLCDNCLFHGHIARTCPKVGFCKVNSCLLKHSTYLHPKTADPDVIPNKQRSQVEKVQETKDRASGGSQNGYVKTKARCNDVTGAGISEVGMPIVPVKVRARGSNRTILTYAFLDPGSNTTFCTSDLMGQLCI